MGLARDFFNVLDLSYPIDRDGFFNELPTDLDQLQADAGEIFEIYEFAMHMHDDDAAWDALIAFTHFRYRIVQFTQPLSEQDALFVHLYEQKLPLYRWRPLSATAVSALHESTTSPTPLDTDFLSQCSGPDLDPDEKDTTHSESVSVSINECVVYTDSSIPSVCDVTVTPPSVGETCESDCDHQDQESTCCAEDQVRVCSVVPTPKFESVFTRQYQHFNVRLKEQDQAHPCGFRRLTPGPRWSSTGSVTAYYPIQEWCRGKVKRKYANITGVEHVMNWCACERGLNVRVHVRRPRQMIRRLIMLSGKSYGCDEQSVYLHMSRNSSMKTLYASALKSLAVHEWMTHQHGGFG